MNEIPTRYNPHETEDRWYKHWEEHGYFHAEPDAKKKPYTIVIPPPNVTGILHMGHALNNTIQDILIRYHRMLGYNSLWMPGTDHAGIATQNVVEKKIAKEGKKRHDLGREKFIEQVWQWKEQYGSTIIRQLKKLGCSCDWQRERFTMDEEYSKSVLEVFVRLYEKGLIYQGTRIINWCPRCQTALSDEEAPHHELQGNLYYLRYPLKDGGRGTKDGGRRTEDGCKEYLVVATTRPETMLGDTAVAVNPKDKRYKHLIGRSLILPLANREIPVIADESVDPKFGTGAVKITPAHDSNDFATGTRHKLEFINVLHPDGRINERGGEYAGMERCEAREAIVEDLRGQNLLEKIEPHPLSAGHCYRCHTIIEPYLSKQWFVSMKPLAQPAIEAVRKGKIVFYPKRWTKVYLNWMENIQDWCISRQIWWGHRIPVYYCATCLKMTEDGGRKTDARRHARQGVMVSRVRPQKCPACGATDIRQDEDVLDTWFSSWLWPFATFGWPFAETGDQTEDARRRTEEDALRYFYPTAALVTAPEIIFFWVARMIMAGFEFQKKEPFRHVYIHGTVRDIEGKKMSKSLGNIIDPLEIIADYGADALRFSLISITAQGQDVFLSRERFEQGRNFANKIWNASRFIMMNMNGVTVAESDSHPVHLDMVNRWIVSRFHSTLRETGKNLQAYKFNEAANLLYSFFWHEFCDWYLELIKADIRNPATQEVMRAVLEDFLKCLHPFMPFVTEDIVYRLRALSARPHASIMTEAWPQADERRIDRKLEKRMEALFAVVTHLRNMRAALMLKPDQKIRVSAYPHTRQSRTQLEACLNLVQDLVKAESIALLDTDSRPRGVLSALAPEIDLYVHLEGVIDIDKETLKIKTEIQKKKESRKAKEERLQNAAFRQKAPADVVAKEEESVRLLGAEVTRLEQMLQDLS